MDKAILVISIITGLLTILGTLAVVCVAWGKMKEFTKNLKNNFSEFKADNKETLDEVKKDYKSINRSIIDIDKTTEKMKEKVDLLWKERIATSASPMILNKRGLKILNDSGIKNIIDEKIEDLHQQVKDKKPRNAYWVQEYTKTVLYKLRKNPDLLPELETSAYNSGEDIDTILFVGSLYLRDKILTKFHFKLDEIDKHDPNQKTS